MFFVIRSLCSESRINKLFQNAFEYKGIVINADFFLFIKIQAQISLVGSSAHTLAAEDYDGFGMFEERTRQPHAQGDSTW